MTREPDDRLLEEAFGALREADRSAVPDVAAMLARARTAAAREDEPEAEGSADRGASSIPVRSIGSAPSVRRGAGRSRIRWRSWGLAVAAAAVAGIITLTTDRGDQDFVRTIREYSQQRESGMWAAPTDGLLRVPGGELIRSVPRFGTPGPRSAPSGGSGPSTESSR